MNDLIFEKMKDDKLSYGMFGLNKWKEKREECKEIRGKKWITRKAN